MINIIITDDHPLVLEGLKNIIAAEEDLSVTACFTSAEDTLDALKTHEPDILLLDINLPDANSIDLVGRLKKSCSSMKIIALSVHNEYAVINSMLSEGADGYIQKNASGTEILSGIQAVWNGKRFLCSQSAAVMARKTEQGLKSVPRITRREKEILQEAARGLTTSEIAAALFISPHTVESHRKNLIEKFGVKNLASAIKLAIEYGIVRE